MSIGWFSDGRLVMLEDKATIALDDNNYIRVMYTMEGYRWCGYMRALLDYAVSRWPYPVYAKDTGNHVAEALLLGSGFIYDTTRKIYVKEGI